MFKYTADSVKSLWSNFNIKSAVVGAVVALVAANYIN